MKFYKLDDKTMIDLNQVVAVQGLFTSSIIVTVGVTQIYYSPHIKEGDDHNNTYEQVVDLRSNELLEALKKADEKTQFDYFYTKGAK